MYTIMYDPYRHQPPPPPSFHSGCSCTDLVPPAVSQDRKAGQTPSHKVCMRRHHQGELQSDVAPVQSARTCCHTGSGQSEGLYKQVKKPELHSNNCHTHTHLTVSYMHDIVH